MTEKIFYEDNLNLSSVIDFYIKNLVNIIIYTIIPFALGIFFIFYTLPFTQDRSKVSAANVYVKNEILGSLSNAYIFSVENVTESINRSGLSERIEVNKEFIKNFRIVNGHSELNILIEEYIDRDDASLTKELYFKPEQIETIRQDLISQGSNFKVLYFKYDTLEINDDEIAFIFKNLIDVINEKIRIDYNFTNLDLKKIEPLVLNSPISSMDVNKINDRLILIRSYINSLNTNFNSFAPNINLRVLLDELNGNEDLFNFLIQENDLYKEMIQKTITLDIKSQKKRIESLNNKLSLFVNTNNINGSNIVSGNQNQTYNADSTFIDTILELGELVNSVDVRNNILNELNIVELSKIQLERRLEDLELKTNFDINLFDAESFLLISLNKTTSKINEYIEIVKTTKKQTELLTQLSISKNAEQSSYFTLMQIIAFLLVGSLSLSFLIVTFKLMRKIN